MNLKLFRLLRIGGWINLTNIKLFWRISKSFNKKIKIFEIGSHYGRSFIPLAINNFIFSKAVVVDIFDKQHLNKSKSGFGSKIEFLKNIKKFNIDSKKITIINDTSLNLLSNKYKKKLKKFNKFDVLHVDGGHNFKEVINDLKLTIKYSNKNSIIIIDDIMNPSFPEVLKAYLKVKSYFYPIFLSDQKIFLARNKTNAKKIYTKIFKNFKINKKKIIFFNDQTFYVDENENDFFNFFKNKLKLFYSLFLTKYHF